MNIGVPSAMASALLTPVELRDSDIISCTVRVRTVLVTVFLRGVLKSPIGPWLCNLNPHFKVKRGRGQRRSRRTR